MSSPVLVTIRDWSLIRDRFTEQEREALNAARCGEVIFCRRGPAGIYVDSESVSRELLEKLTVELSKVQI